MTKLDILFEKKYGAIRGGQTKLAKELKADQSTISSWLSGRNKPTVDYIKKMAQVFSVSEAEIRAIFFSEEKGNEYVQALEATPLTPNNTVTLPILADVPAGLPDYSDRDVEFFHSIPRNMFPGADFIIHCIGDSLSPKFNLGDYCVIRKTTDPMHGRAMIVKTENGICMKVINKTKDGVQLCSLNKKYKPFYPKELKIIGLIIGHWSRDDRENLLQPN